jgi:hypothetical protein
LISITVPLNTTELVFISSFTGLGGAHDNACASGTALHIPNMAIHTANISFFIGFSPRQQLIFFDGSGAPDVAEEHKKHRIIRS